MADKGKVVAKAKAEASDIVNPKLWLDPDKIRFADLYKY